MPNCAMKLPLYSNFALSWQFEIIKYSSIPRSIAEVLDNQNLFTESNLAKWFSSYVQFCSGGHFSERAGSAR